MKWTPSKLCETRSKVLSIKLSMFARPVAPTYHLLRNPKSISCFECRGTWIKYRISTNALSKMVESRAVILCSQLFFGSQSFRVESLKIFESKVSSEQSLTFPQVFHWSMVILFGFFQRRVSHLEIPDFHRNFRDILLVMSSESWLPIIPFDRL
jgi:hypothetical protein